MAGGLGLYMSQVLMAAQGGRITVSRSGGQGSRFTLYFSGRGGIDMSGLLLIVDDEPHVLLLLRLTLKARGWTVVEAADGYEALERCRRQPSPAAVVLDQRMSPGPSGLEVAAILRDEGFTAPIALHSTYFPPEVAEQAEAAGLSLIAKGNLEHLAEVLPKLVNDH